MADAGEFRIRTKLEMERGMLMVRNCACIATVRHSPSYSAYFSHPIAQQLGEEV